ncbi:hypothetical protein BC833DRAFT_583095 [Globomyces pollinis-pini]|nr:hypothetical protein BC833DRAFT_583095 [Globomyces pollinis-pini]
MRSCLLKMNDHSQTVLLAVDESALVGPAILWTIKSVVAAGDTLVIAGCAYPSIPGGRSTDGFGNQ